MAAPINKQVYISEIATLLGVDADALKSLDRIPKRSLSTLCTHLHAAYATAEVTKLPDHAPRSTYQWARRLECRLGVAINDLERAPLTILRLLDARLPPPQRPLVAARYAVDPMLRSVLREAGDRSWSALPETSRARLATKLMALVEIPPRASASSADAPDRPYAPLHMAAFAVSQGIYEHVMGGAAKARMKVDYEHTTGGSSPRGYRGASLPMQLSWFEAVTFCNTLSAQEGLEPAYVLDEARFEQVVIDRASRLHREEWGAEDTVARVSVADVVWRRGANGYRLPTEAEWLRGANATPEFRHAGSDDLHRVAWVSGTGHLIGTAPQPVGLKCHNGLGLFDMTGNIGEWCWDVSPWATDGPTHLLKRIVRGLPGGLRDEDHRRTATLPTRVDHGLRLCRTP